MSSVLFQMYICDWYLQHYLCNNPHVNDTHLNWWWLNINSGDCFYAAVNLDQCWLRSTFVMMLFGVVRPQWFELYLMESIQYSCAFTRIPPQSTSAYMRQSTLSSSVYVMAGSLFVTIAVTNALERYFESLYQVNPGWKFNKPSHTLCLLDTRDGLWSQNDFYLLHWKYSSGVQRPLY